MTEASTSWIEYPTKLDEIVRRHRERFEVGLATAAEQAAITGDVDTRATPRDTIKTWHLIALRDRTLGQTTMHVLGRVHPDVARITSYIAVLAPDRSHVRTKNSLYRLGPEGHGEPGLALIFLVAAALRRWGLDQHYDLGVIPVHPDWAPPP